MLFHRFLHTAHQCKYMLLIVFLSCRPVVKKLINKFDFEALNVKVERCKVRYHFIWM